MIKIEKRKIEVNTEEFREELRELCRLIKRHSPSTYGVTLKGINDHFNLKLKETDFYILCDVLGYKTRRGSKARYLHFDDLEI